METGIQASKKAQEFLSSIGIVNPDTKIEFVRNYAIEGATDSYGDNIMGIAGRANNAHVPILEGQIGNQEAGDTGDAFCDCPIQ